MQNNFITKISPSVRILVLILLSLILLMAKSVYLILFITTLTLILSIITGKKVKQYVKLLKKLSFLLLFFLIIYIIVFKHYQILDIIVFAYKLIIIQTLFAVFIFNIDFKGIHYGLYGIIMPLEKLNVNVESLSLNVTLSLYFIKILLQAKDELKKSQTINGKKILSIRKFIISILIYSINQLNLLQDNLKIKFYNLNYKKDNLYSKIILLLFVLIFIICIFKEVIL